MLNIIFGASGIGKQRLCDAINIVKYVKSFDLITKGTTREIMDYDGTELTNIKSDKIDSDVELKKKYSITYPHNLDRKKPDYWFGIKTEDLERANSEKTNYFLFCNDIDVIKKLDLTYTNTRVFLFQIDDYPALIKRQGNDNSRKRIKRMRELYRIAHKLENMALFDGIIFYKFLPSMEWISTNLMIRQLFDLIKEKTDCVEYNAASSDQIVVMMPFGTRRFEKDHYKCVFDAIKKTIEEATNGVYKVVRITNAGSIIMQEIIKALNDSRAVIVDLSQARSSCLFEAGFTVGMDKSFLFICDKHTDVGFDAGAYRVEKYDLESDPKHFRANILEWLKRERILEAAANSKPQE